MSLFKIIFVFEWRQFMRRPFQLLMFLLFLIMGFYSLYSGRQFVEGQLSGLDTLINNQQNHVKELISRFQGDTTTEKGKIFAQQAGLPQIIEYRASPLATHPPQALAVLAIGQRDILPYYDVINSKRNVLTPPNTEIANPEKLASGNFDLSFLIIYLFPLLIISLCYDLYAREKEQQTDRLLNVQSGNLHQIILNKLLFRFILVGLLAAILSITGFLIHPAAAPLAIKDAVLWCFVVFTYLLFWFSVCWLMIVHRGSSRISSLALTGIWLLLTLVLPAIVNKLAELKHPMPLRTDLVAKQRETMLETWEIPIKELLEKFYQNNPAYLSLRKGSDTAVYGNKRFVAYYDLLGRRMNTNVNKYQQEAWEHNSWLNKMAWLNPVTQMQGLVNGTAQTGLGDYLYYQRQAGQFQDQWVKLMNGYLLSDRKLSQAEVMALPNFRPSKDETRLIRILTNTCSVWLATFVIFLFARRKRIHY